MKEAANHSEKSSFDDRTLDEILTVYMDPDHTNRELMLIASMSSLKKSNPVLGGALEAFLEVQDIDMKLDNGLKGVKILTEQQIMDLHNKKSNILRGLRANLAESKNYTKVKKIYAIKLAEKQKSKNERSRC